MVVHFMVNGPKWYATNVSTAPTQQRAATVERGIVTPVIVSKPVVEQSMPRRLLTRMMRQESGEKRVFIPGGLSFMETLSHSIQKTRDRIVEKGERSRVLVDNGLHSGGRVWLLWDPSMFDVNVKDVTAQAIHSEAVERESLWNSIRDYHRGINGPWVVCGDFNAILDFNERIGGAPVSYADVLPLAQVTQDCNLADLKATGAFFTWNNKYETGDKVYSRIDRVMINDDWITTFPPDSVANFLPEGLFDHCPCLISLECSHQQRTKSFKYFNMWAFSKEFDSTVRNCWSTVVQGTPMFRVVQKLKLLKKAFRNLNREKFSDIENLTNVAELALKDIQVNLVQDPLNSELCHTEKMCAAVLGELIKARNMFLSQKAKAAWIAEGDENSSYFHSVIKKRRSHNRPVTPINQAIVRMGPCLTADHRASLLAPLSDNEIKRAMFDIPVAIPDNVKQFRPIACCNTVYKCLSKLICNRLRDILPDIISPSQSAFIKGRDIVGNILICQDLIRLYKRKACSPRLLMKLDLQKAYDSR
ncbi:uncharacterized protein LOC141641583 [Silene latifolia]|uniref:uncharacterized protein LOC141641583 n=1 Tax=Silene latifolia TaxID=37657 RepID=UPI003D77EEEF